MEDEGADLSCGAACCGRQARNAPGERRPTVSGGTWKPRSPLVLGRDGPTSGREAEKRRPFCSRRGPHFLTAARCGARYPRAAAYGSRRSGGTGWWFLQRNSSPWGLSTATSVANGDAVTNGSMEIRWDPPSRIAFVRYVRGAVLSAADGAVLVDALSGWIRNERPGVRRARGRRGASAVPAPHTAPSVSRFFPAAPGHRPHRAHQSGPRDPDRRGDGPRGDRHPAQGSSDGRGGGPRLAFDGEGASPREEYPLLRRHLRRDVRRLGRGHDGARARSRHPAHGRHADEVRDRAQHPARRPGAHRAPTCRRERRADAEPASRTGCSSSWTRRESSRRRPATSISCSAPWHVASGRSSVTCARFGPSPRTASGWSRRGPLHHRDPGSARDRRERSCRPAASASAKESPAVW